MKWSDRRDRSRVGRDVYRANRDRCFLVRTLIASQFPHWAHLPVKPVVSGGWDNRTFHLGHDMTVRLPSAARYAAQVEKEQRWLLRLAPFAFADPCSAGVWEIPALGYPWHWSVYRWLEGESRYHRTHRRFTPICAHPRRIPSRSAAASIRWWAGPGPHNFYRGGRWRSMTRRPVRPSETWAEQSTADAVASAWEARSEDRWHGSTGLDTWRCQCRKLAGHQRLFECCHRFRIYGRGRPACDCAIAWTLFSGESRDAFRSALPLDSGTWVRGRGWALWKALITLAEQRRSDSLEAANARRVLEAVVAEHQRQPA